MIGMFNVVSNKNRRMKESIEKEEKLQRASIPMKKKSRYVVHYQEMSSYLLFAARRKEMEDERRAQKLIDARGADVQPATIHIHNAYTHTNYTVCVDVFTFQIMLVRSSEQDKS